ncbi:hypothetical protein, partial [Trebonia sp.]|uniref:hypothetical protein n=1 Tax=Trebonia sp. TaxID=2767075 RepID=UPI00261DA378
GQLLLKLTDVGNGFVHDRVVSGHLLPEIHDLLGWRGMVEEGHPNVPHRLLGPAEFEQAREEFLLSVSTASEN